MEGTLQVAAIGQVVNDLSVAVNDFGARDVLDILIVAMISYFVLIFIKQTRSYFILTAVLVLLSMKFVSETFELELTQALVEPLLTTLALVVVVLFQRDIRRFFKWISAGRSFGFTSTMTASVESFSVIADTVWEMASNRIGAIVVLPGEAPLDDLLEGGVTLDGEISRPLLLSIFDSNSPGHDGAVLIENNRIKCFGLHLPLAEDFTAIGRVGTRHRAAAGITQKTDAMAIVVSEERGEVSVTERGLLRLISNKEELLDILKTFSHTDTEEAPRNFWHYLLVNNVWIKVASVLLSIILWIIIH
jgi:diadenylate cyclase